MGPNKHDNIAWIIALAEISTQTCPRWLLVTQPKSLTSWASSPPYGTHTHQQWALRSSTCASRNLCQVGQSWAYRTPLGCRGAPSSRQNTAGSWRAAGREVGRARMSREGQLEWWSIATEVAHWERIGSHLSRAHRKSHLG